MQQKFACAIQWSGVVVISLVVVDVIKPLTAILFVVDRVTTNNNMLRKNKHDPKRRELSDVLNGLRRNFVVTTSDHQGRFNSQQFIGRKKYHFPLEFKFCKKKHSILCTFALVKHFSSTSVLPLLLLFHSISFIRSSLLAETLQRPNYYHYYYCVNQATRMMMMWWPSVRLLLLQTHIFFSHYLSFVSQCKILNLKNYSSHTLKWNLQYRCDKFLGRCSC